MANTKPSRMRWATALREVMAMSGAPKKFEYRRNREAVGLYEEHAEQWERAKAVLAQYDLTKL
jgi:hypothetical protein